MIDCAVFVYKHTFCSKGELIIGNNGYEIIYEPRKSKPSIVKFNSDHLKTPSASPRQAYSTPSPSQSANSSNFLLSFIGHLSPSMVAKNTDILHRIVINWDTISGLQRKNKTIKYSDKDDAKIELIEQLIIESTSFPTLHIMEYNHDTLKYETKSMQSLRTHYIGLEYDLIHSHDILLGSNYDRIKAYNFDDAFDINTEETQSIALLEKNPSYSVLINHSLPAWIWIPLLNHTLRVFIERVILFGNIGLFIWTIYQMTKYTSIIKGFYEHIFYPFFDYISKPILRKMCYFVNLMHFHIVVQLFGNIFNLLYNYIPINFLHGLIGFVDQHVLQQIINLFTMFYRLFTNTYSLFSPLFQPIITALRQCFALVPQCNCLVCKRLSFICDHMQFVMNFVRRCCGFCQRSGKFADSSTKILKAGVRVMDSENGLDGNADAVSSICGMVGYICDYLRTVGDIFWLGIGKPIKHIYDFFRYIRSEVGVVVGICIRKICRKSKAKIQKAGKKVLEEAKNTITKRRNASVSDSERESDCQLSDDMDTRESEERSESILSRDVRNKIGLRFRGNKG